MADEEQGERVNKGESRGGVRGAVGDGINVYHSTCAKLGICGAVIFFVIFSLILGLAIPIAALVIGVLHKDDCPIEKKIPLYLIVAGAGGLISNFLGTFLRPANDNEHTPTWRRTVAKKAGCCVTIFTFINGLLSIFLFIWFIMGNVWVFGNYDQRDQCNYTVYWFAFVTIAISDAIIALLLVGGILSCCCLCCCALCKRG